MATPKRARFALGTVLAVLASGALVVLILGLSLLTKDVHVPIEGNERDSGSSFCGSAYDVTFLKRNGYMGGEYPNNQREIDAACIEKASQYSYRGRALAIAGLGSLVVASVALLVLWLIRRSRAANDNQVVAAD